VYIALYFYYATRLESATPDGRVVRLVGTRQTPRMTAYDDENIKSRKVTLRQVRDVSDQSVRRSSTDRTSCQRHVVVAKFRIPKNISEWRSQLLLEACLLCVCC